MINEQNNLDDRFETRRFDEGRPCGEPPCKSLVQPSRMLVQKRPLLRYATFCDFSSEGLCLFERLFCDDNRAFSSSLL